MTKAQGGIPGPSSCAGGGASAGPRRRVRLCAGHVQHLEHLDGAVLGVRVARGRPHEGLPLLGPLEQRNRRIASFREALEPPLRQMVVAQGSEMSITTLAIYAGLFIGGRLIKLVLDTARPFM